MRAFMRICNGAETNFTENREKLHNFAKKISNKCTVRASNSLQT